MNKKIAVYPGSFDPVTNGHLDIISRSSELFDRLIVGVLKNTSKPCTFAISERIAMLEDCTRGIKNVYVASFDGLLVNFMRQHRARVIVRGLRAISDFEYEFQMALMNRNLYPQVETVFLMTDEHYSYLSSSIVKELAGFNADIKSFVPRSVMPYLNKQRSARAKKSSDSSKTTVRKDRKC